jgi:hypothetical protein
MDYTLNRKIGKIHASTCGYVEKLHTDNRHDFDTIDELLNMYEANGNINPPSQCVCMKKHADALTKVYKRYPQLLG